MAKNRNRFAIGQARQQMVEAVGSDKAELDLPDGTVLSWEHPLFRSRAMTEELRPLEDDDSVGISKILLGAKQWDALVAACDGDEDAAAEEFMFTNAQAARAGQGALTNGRPTR